MPAEEPHTYARAERSEHTSAAHGWRARDASLHLSGMVAQFAVLVSDSNPVHLDADYAARTSFGQPIVHGMFVASLISGILGERLPGPGSIYLGQTLRFEAPVFVDGTVTARVEVIAVRVEKRIVTLRTECVREDGVRVISGEAIVKC